MEANCPDLYLTKKDASKLLTTIRTQVKGLDDDVPVWELPHLHGAVSAAREEARAGVHVELRHALPDVLKEGGAGVLSGE